MGLTVSGRARWNLPGISVTFANQVGIGETRAAFIERTQEAGKVSSGERHLPAAGARRNRNPEALPREMKFSGRQTRRSSGGGKSGRRLRDAFRVREINAENETGGIRGL